VLLLNQHFETRQRILPLKTGEYFMNKAQEVGARTTLELYQKAATLDMGAPFRVEDGSIRVHARRAKSKGDKVNSRKVCDALVDEKSVTGKLVTLSSGWTTFMCCRTSTAVPIPNTFPVKQQVALQPVQHTDGITYTRA